MNNRSFKPESKTTTSKKLVFFASLILALVANPTVPVAQAFGPSDHGVLNTFNDLASELQIFKSTQNFSLPKDTPQPVQPVANNEVANSVSANMNIAAILPALKSAWQGLVKPISNINLNPPTSETNPVNQPKVEQTIKLKSLATAALSRADIQAMIDKAIGSIDFSKNVPQVIYRSSGGDLSGLAFNMGQTIQNVVTEVSSGSLFDQSSITSLTNLTTASTSNFFGAGLVPCQSGNVLTYNGSGQFGCATDATGVSASANSKWATSTNQSAIYPNGGTNVAVVIGATATTTNSKFEVTGGALFDRSTSTNATTTSLFATTLSAGSLTTSGLATIANILAAGSTTLQNLTFVNATGTQGTTTNFFATNLVATNATATSFFTTNGFGTTETLTGLQTSGNLLVTGSSTLQNLTFTNATGTQATTTNFFATNLVATSATTTNFFATNNFGTTETLTGLQTSGNLVVNGSSTLQNLTFVNATGSQATTTNFFATSLFGTSGNITNATTSTIFATTASTTNFFSNNGTVGTFTAGLINGQTISSAASFSGTLTATAGLTTLSNLTVTGSSTLQNITFLNSTSTNATTTTFFATTASTTNFFSNNGTIGQLTAGPITSGLINSQTISSTASFTGTLTATAGLTTLSNLTVTGSSTLQNVTFLKSTSTNATTTTFFATTASTTNFFSNNGTIGQLTAGPITSGLINSQTISSAASFSGTLTATAGLTTLSNLLVNGSSTLQNLTGLNATTSSATSTNFFVTNFVATSATTTNFFATTASSTNLFAANSTFGALTVSGAVTFSGLAATTTAGQDVCYGQAGGAIGAITHTNGTSACSASSRRFKQDINPLDSSSGIAEIMALNPVSFKYTNQYLGGFVNDPNWTKPFVGFIAEDVATVDPRLISVDDQGLPVNVQYPNITAILTKAFQEQQLIIQDLQTKIASLGVSVGNAIANFAQVVADVVTAKKLTVGDSANLTASGITVLDRATGAPTCVFVESGVLKSATGECGTQPIIPPAGTSGTDQTPPPPSDSGSTSNQDTSTTTPPQGSGNNATTMTATSTQP